METAAQSMAVEDLATNAQLCAGLSVERVADLGEHASQAGVLAKRKSVVTIAAERVADAQADSKRQSLATTEKKNFKQYLAVKMAVGTLSEAVTNLIQNHHDVTGVVNVKRFTEKICQTLFNFAGDCSTLSLKDLNKIVGAQLTADVWLYTLDRKGSDQWIKKQAFTMDDFPAYGFEDPLLHELYALQKTEVLLENQRAGALMDERDWFSARKAVEMQFHAARTITAACANRFHLTTFMFLTLDEYETTTKRLHSQFGCTQIPVMEFLIGYDGMMPPGANTMLLAEDDINKQKEPAIKNALTMVMQAAGIVIILCEFKTVNSFHKMFIEIMSDNSAFQEAICFGYCIVVPYCNFDDSELNRLMHEKFLQATVDKTSEQFCKFVPHLVVDLAKK